MRRDGDCKQVLEGGIALIQKPEGEHEVRSGPSEDAEVPHLVVSEDARLGIGALADIDDRAARVGQTANREP